MYVCNDLATAVAYTLPVSEMGTAIFAAAVVIIHFVNDELFRHSSVSAVNPNLYRRHMSSCPEIRLSALSIVGIRDG